MVYRTAPFSMTFTTNPRVRVRVRVEKVRKPYPNFQMVPLSMILNDLCVDPHFKVTIIFNVQ